ncbi:MAG: hypothetical protein KJ561_05400 [Nanoarchaeota archaeon]|nr:hypothetical protein [Nanoarchaeota archaeon]
MSLEKSLIFLGHKKIKDNFLAAFLTADNNSLISSGNLVTGNMVKITGMAGI